MTARARAAALLFVPLLASCPGPTPRPTATGSTTPTPRVAGEIVVAYPYEPATLDPFTVAGDSIPTRDLVRLVMPSLERVGPGGERSLWLLASEPVVTEGPPFSVTLTLRDDAIWSDRTPITVADLRATWRLVMRRDGISRDGYDRIDRIVAETPKRARIEFDEPYVRWRRLFNEGLGVIPAHVRARTFARGWPVSGGPFVLKGWRRGLDVRFARNPRAWGGVPAAASIRFAFVPDSLGARELFRRGEVDVLGPYHAPDWSRIAAGFDGAKVTTDVSATWAGLLMNVRAPPLRQAAVRRAFAASVGRAQIERGLVQDEGELLLSPGIGEPVPIGTGRRRLDEANAMLADAGWTGAPVRSRNGVGLDFTLAVVAEDDLAFVVAQALKFQAADAGFSFESIPLDPARYWGEWLPGDEFDAAFVLWRGAGPAAVAGRARLRDARLNRALDAADSGGDAAVAGRRLARLVPVIPLYRVAVSLTAAASVTGVRSSAGPDGPFWNAFGWRIQ